MGKFGWSYPPGAALDPFAPYNQVDGPCAICGKSEDACICPECPVCHTNGADWCYRDHGLVRSPEQIASLAEAEAQWAKDAEAESAAWCSCSGAETGCKHSHWCPQYVEEDDE